MESAHLTTEAAGDPVSEIDVSTTTAARVVLPFAVDGDAGSVTPDLTADILLDGQDTTGQLDRFDFEVVEQPDGSFSVELPIEGLPGASDLERLAEGVESAGIDPADAGARLIEDRGGDGVLELEVRIRGTVDTTGAGDADVDTSVTANLVESGKAAPEPSAPEGKASANIVDGKVRLTGEGGSAATAPAPTWDKSLVRATQEFLEYLDRDLPSNALMKMQILSPPVEFATYVNEDLAFRRSNTGWKDVVRTSAKVDGKPAIVAISNDGTTYGVIWYVDLGGDVLQVMTFGPAAGLAKDRATIDKFVQSFSLTSA
jgi:hypothetical protein